MARLLRSTWRSFITIPHRTMISDSGAYDAPGKMIAHILNREEEDMILVDSYSNHGFRLNSGLFVIGPCAIFPRTLFQWDVRDVQDIDIPSMSLFYLVEPKIDILVIGVGDEENVKDFDPAVRVFLKEKKINCEVLPSSRAAGMFNFMNQELRNVACGLIPPTNVMYDNASRNANWERMFESTAAKRNYFERNSTVDEVIRFRDAKEATYALFKGKHKEQGVPYLRREGEKVEVDGPLQKGKAIRRFDDVPVIPRKYLGTNLNPSRDDGDDNRMIASKSEMEAMRQEMKEKEDDKK